MRNIEKYNTVLKTNLNIAEQGLCDEVLVFERFKRWSASQHKKIIAQLEAIFHIKFSSEDVRAFNTYSRGIYILKRLGVDMSA